MIPRYAQKMNIWSKPNVSLFLRSLKTIRHKVDRAKFKQIFSHSEEWGTTDFRQETYFYLSFSPTSLTFSSLTLCRAKDVLSSSWEIPEKKEGERASSSVRGANLIKKRVNHQVTISSTRMWSYFFPDRCCVVAQSPWHLPRGTTAVVAFSLPSLLLLRFTDKKQTRITIWKVLCRWLRDEGTNRSRK